MFAERTMLSSESVPFQESKRREFIMKNNNQINIPQAREAMDKFKMLIKLPRSALTCEAATTPH